MVLQCDSEVRQSLSLFEESWYSLASSALLSLLVATGRARFRVVQSLASSMAATRIVLTSSDSRGPGSAPVAESPGSAPLAESPRSTPEAATLVSAYVPTTPGSAPVAATPGSAPGRHSSSTR